MIKKKVFMPYMMNSFHIKQFCSIIVSFGAEGRLVFDCSSSESDSSGSDSGSAPLTASFRDVRRRLSRIGELHEGTVGYLVV